MGKKVYLRVQDLGGGSVLDNLRSKVSHPCEFLK